MCVNIDFSHTQKYKKTQKNSAAPNTTNLTTSITLGGAIDKTRLVASQEVGKADDELFRAKYGIENTLEGRILLLLSLIMLYDELVSGVYYIISLLKVIWKFV